MLFVHDEHLHAVDDPATGARAETLAALRAAVQNGAIADTLPRVHALRGERVPDGDGTGVTFLASARRAGCRCASRRWTSRQNTDHLVFVARRAAHPNAAKLLAAVLAGPEGRAHPGGVDRRRQPLLPDSASAAGARGARQGFPSFAWVDNPEALDFALSPTARPWRAS